MAVSSPTVGTWNNVSSATSLSVTAPSGSTGDLLTLHLATEDASLDPSGGLSGWTEICDNSGSSCRNRAYIKEADSSNDSPTVTFGATKTQIGGVILRWSGHLSADPTESEDSSDTVGGSNTITFSSLSVTDDGSMRVAAVFTQDDFQSTASFSTSFANSAIYTGDNSDGLGGGIVYEAVDSGSTGTDTVSHSSFLRSGSPGVSFIIRPDAGGGGGPSIDVNGESNDWNGVSVNWNGVS